MCFVFVCWFFKGGLRKDIHFLQTNGGRPNPTNLNIVRGNSLTWEFARGGEQCIPPFARRMVVPYLQDPLPKRAPDLVLGRFLATCGLILVPWGDIFSFLSLTGLLKRYILPI